MNNNCEQNLQAIQTLINNAETDYQRPLGSVNLLAISKRHSMDKIKALYQAGVRSFGESYLQEALEKIHTLEELAIEWHYIGPIQSNKLKKIAENFTWVQSVAKLSTAEKLSQYRPAHLPPLNICIQINIDNEETKSGAHQDDILALAKTINQLPNLKLRGLMSIPAPCDDFTQQRITFKEIADIYKSLQESFEDIDTLSMGMSNDFVAAIAEGSTLVRIGTKLFGRRPC